MGPCPINADEPPLDFRDPPSTRDWRYTSAQPSGFGVGSFIALPHEMHGGLWKWFDCCVTDFLQDDPIGSVAGSRSLRHRYLRDADGV